MEAWGPPGGWRPRHRAHIWCGRTRHAVLRLVTCITELVQGTVCGRTQGVWRLLALPQHAGRAATARACLLMFVAAHEHSLHVNNLTMPMRASCACLRSGRKGAVLTGDSPGLPTTCATELKGSTSSYHRERVNMQYLYHELVGMRSPSPGEVRGCMGTR